MKRAGRRTVKRCHRTSATIRSTGSSSRRGTGIPSVRSFTRSTRILFQQNSRPQDPGRRAAIRAKAVAYLEHAAARGSADAYLLLASSYERGGLTQKNPALAYSYLSALAKVTGDPGVANKAISLRSSLPNAGAAEAMAARLAASCCLSATHRPVREEEN